MLQAVPGLRRARERRGLSREELADRCGLHPIAVRRLEESGFRADDTVVAQLAAALGVDPRQLTEQPAGPEAIGQP